VPAPTRTARLLGVPNAYLHGVAALTTARYPAAVITAAEQSVENLTGAFIMILVIIAMSFLAGYGLCFMRLSKRKDK
jgi:hypothetical protein